MSCTVDGNIRGGDQVFATNAPMSDDMHPTGGAHHDRTKRNEGIVNNGSEIDESLRDDEKGAFSKSDLDAAAETDTLRTRKAKYTSPYDRWVVPVQKMSWANPTKLWNWTKFLTLRGISIDVVSHDSALLHAIHAKAHRYDVRVEHLWTYCQVVSAMLMSIAHGSNDIANAVGPISAVYSTWQEGVVATENDTPIWLLVIGGLMLGTGFWFLGYKVMRT